MTSPVLLDTAMSPFVILLGFVVPIVILVWVDRRLRRESPGADRNV
jgi:hypothetical protein